MTHRIDLASGWCEAHGMRCDVELEAERAIVDPVDLPFESRPLRPGEEECAHRGCLVPIARYGGLWFHAGKAGDHYPRPKVSGAALDLIRRTVSSHG